MLFNPKDWFAALDAVAVRSKALPRVDRDADRRAMVQFLQTHPGFEAADVTPDGDIWALLKDGPLVTLVDGARDVNQTAVPGELLETPTGRGLFTPRGLPVAPAPQTATTGPKAATGIPASPFMHLLLGPGFDMPMVSADMRGFLEKCRAHGYEPKHDKATLANLRAVKDVGVLYICTHGGQAAGFREGKLTGVFAYALTANEPAYLLLLVPQSPKTPEEEKQFLLLRSDVMEGRVTLQLLLGDDTPYFAITPAFVEHYMTFALNSWVFVTGCHSNDDMLREAFFGRKASLYTSWNGDPNEPAASRAGTALFNLLLGSKTICPGLQPEQRPFGYQLAWEYLKTQNMTTCPQREGGNAELVNRPVERADFRMLAPSIQRLEVAEQRNELRILGLFGKDPGESLRKVTINGTELRVSNWEEEEILCELASSGDGTSGDVVVEVHKHKSNPRRLSEWQGTFVVWKTLYAAGMGVPSSLRAEAAFHMHWRTDAQSFRVKPCTAPVYPKQSEGNVQDAFLPMADSTVSINAGGIDAYPDGAMRLWTLLGPTKLPHHTSTEPLLFNPKVPLGWFAKFSMDLQNKRMLILLAAKVIDGVLYKQISGGGATSPPDRKEEFLIWTSPLGITGKPPWGMQVSLDDKCSVGKDTRTDKLGIWNGEWGKIEAKWPPDPEAAQ